MTVLVEQWIWLKLCVKLEHSSVETIWMTQKTAVMGNWWSTASSQQYTHWCIKPPAEFLVRDQITQVTRHPHSLDSVTCNFWLFPKLKSHFKRMSFQNVEEIQENMKGQLMAIERTVWSPKVPTFKVTEALLSCVQFLVSCIFFNKHLYFS